MKCMVYVRVGMFCRTRCCASHPISSAVCCHFDPLFAIWTKSKLAVLQGCTRVAIDDCTFCPEPMQWYACRVIDGDLGWCCCNWWCEAHQICAVARYCGARRVCASVNGGDSLPLVVWQFFALVSYDRWTQFRLIGFSAARLGSRSASEREWRTT